MSTCKHALPEMHLVLAVELIELAFEHLVAAKVPGRTKDA